MISITYPDFKRDESVVESFHGVQIMDPYRYLEDLQDSRTIDFLNKQEDLAKPFILNNEHRDEIRTFFTNSINFIKRSVSDSFPDYLFYSENSGLQNHSILYRKNKLTEEIKPILDINLLSDDGSISIGTWKFSHDGKILAYGLSHMGSDWIEIHFMNTITCEILSDVLNNVKFSDLSWMKNNSGIFYSKYDRSDDKNARDFNQKLYFHIIGTNQSQDILICEFPNNPNYLVSGCVSDCGKWLIVSVKESCMNNAIYVINLNNFPNEKSNMIPIFDKIEFDYDYITNFGDDFLFRTNKDAINYKIIKVNIQTKYVIDFLDEHIKDVLDKVDIIFENYLLLTYITDVKNTLKLYSMKDKRFVHDFTIGIATVSNILAKKDNSTFFYKVSSFCVPEIIYECDLSKSDFKPIIFFKSDLKSIKTDDFIVEQQFYESNDGERIPMFLLHKKNFERNGASPCLLYGYGGFNISIMPSFVFLYFGFLQMLNGCVAIANIRGGGEYGKKWHENGKLLKKQNVFNDFICAAEYLIQKGYTSSKNLIAYGGSNGGLLVAACMNQRPDLFGVCCIAVGVLDMLRFHKFTAGHIWQAEYGDLENEIHFKNLLSYSPLHNIKVPPNDGQYPAVLVLAADNDDRVVPFHSLKFIAQLQYELGRAKNQKNPLILYFSRKVGHGSGKTVTKKICEMVDIFCFLCNVLKLDVSLKSSNDDSEIEKLAENVKRQLTN